jgi:class 3 adenylate cyclase
MMVVPEDDFIGFVAGNNRATLGMSLVIVFAVAGLAALLVRQGLRADRFVRWVTERDRTITQQSALYKTIAEQIAQGATEAPPALTEGLIATTGAQRASVWRLDARKRVLQCMDSDDRAGQDHASRGHAGGFELHRHEMPAFFEFLERLGDLTVVEDASADERTAQFHNIMMRPLGTCSLAVIPLKRGERTIGAICLEDAGPLEGAHEFLRTSAAMLASAWRVATPSTEKAAAAPAQERTRRSERTEPSIRPTDLGQSPVAQADLRAQHFPEVAAMVLLLSGSLALAEKSADGDIGLAARIAELLQEIFGKHGIGYLKFVGQESIAVAGLEPDGEEAMNRLADAAIALRDRLMDLADNAGAGAEFRIGLSFGPAFGCMLGREREQFNLWGEAIETAEIMARSAAPGAIQASASAYARLRQDFLFRPRGSFYVPGIGQSRTFVLAGQL